MSREGSRWRHDTKESEMSIDFGTAHDKLLFTPGPLTTSRSVKAAMLQDLGSRDSEFIDIVAKVRRDLVSIGGDDGTTYTAVPVQGAGTFGLESVVSSVIAPEGGLLVVVNGAYGRRLVDIATTLGIYTVTLEYPENTIPNPEDVRRALEADTRLTIVSMCHCETTTGILNPVVEVGRVAADRGCDYFVDGMSSFGGIELDLAAANVDYLCSSANKCIEGVPGFSFVIARRAKLEATEGRAQSVSLDLLAQYRGLEKNGQFRFTPPVQSIIAFYRALQELEAEGGVPARSERYRQNHTVLLEGMTRIGFKAYLPRELQSPIITSFLYPDDSRWDFDLFYNGLAERGYVIYPGKAGTADCFRIGSIGRIYPSDIEALLSAIQRVVVDMGLKLK